MATVKLFEPGNNSFGMNQIIRCRSFTIAIFEIFPGSYFIIIQNWVKLKSSRKCQIFAIFLISEIHKIDLEAIFFRILKVSAVKT